MLIKNAGSLGYAQTRPRRKQGSNSFAAHVGGCGSSLCQELPGRAAHSILSLDFVPTFKFYRSRQLSNEGFKTMVFGSITEKRNFSKGVFP